MHLGYFFLSIGKLPVLIKAEANALIYIIYNSISKNDFEFS